MEKQYWTYFYCCLVLLIILVIMELFFIVIFLIKKNEFKKKKKDYVTTIVAIVLTPLMISIMSYEFSCCYKDYNYVTSGTYEEGIGTVISYTFPDDRSGETGTLPKFYFKEKDEYRILKTKHVEIGKTYLVRYYPNSRICEIIKEVGT